MSPLIDLLETIPLRHEGAPPGRYDSERGLRVDERGVPVVDVMRSGSLGTETRGGADRDESAAQWLDTITKQEGTDRDEPRALLLTKTAGGRDVDDDGSVRAGPGFSMGPSSRP